MLTPAWDAIRAHIEANYTALPMRWPNEGWPMGVNPQANGLPFIELEIIGGRNRLVGFGMFGQRTFVHPGILRIYICVPASTGARDAVVTGDAFAAFLERTEFGRTGTQAVRTQDFSIFDSVATIEDGSYSVIMTSCPFDFYYQG